MRHLFIVTFLVSLLLAFNDSDLDGVEDSKDLCPNTPLDAIVDKNGCSKEQNLKRNNDYSKDINIEIYFDSSLNDFQEKSNTLNIYFSYYFNTYLLSTNISKYKLEDKNSFDISLSAQKDIDIKSFTISPYLQTKFYINNPYNKKSDYTFGVSLNHEINSKSYLFSSASYTINGSQNDSKNRNYIDLSLGYGYNINSKLSTSISINYESKTQKDLTNELYTTLSLNYNINSKYYTYINYSYYFKTNSYKHSYTLGIGANF